MACINNIRQQYLASAAQRMGELKTGFQDVESGTGRSPERDDHRFVEAYVYGGGAAEPDQRTKRRVQCIAS